MNATIQVSVVEDDAGVRRELASRLEGFPGFRCLETYADAEAALAGIARRPPGLVLMDINLPGMSGIDCVRRLKQARPSLPIVMVTVQDDSETLFQSLAAGANGYLLKRSPRPKLFEALREICAGGVPMSRSIARKVLEFFHRPGQWPVPAGQPVELPGLTPREREILANLAKGHSYKEIAADLGISGDTTRKHMGRIYEKLQVHSRTEALLKYLGR